MNSIRQNLAGMNAQRYQSINIKNQNKTLEKLASGYRVNTAADDAAVLSISQKMRAQMIGYSQGVDNAEDGIAFLNTADGVMMEVASMLDRMKQLTMESLNGTLTDRDRSLIEAEYEQLQTETDRIIKGTKFNGINLFEQHEDTYYSISGNRKWPYDLMHQIDNSNNELILSVSDGNSKYRLSVTVPPGVYTTQELSDEIDNALDEQASGFPGFTMEFDYQGLFHFHYEGGTMVDEISGGLSYLLYDSYGGNGYGMLLGTTQFEAGWPLKVTSKNNELEFSVEDYGGNSSQITIYVPEGDYTRQEMIDFLNVNLRNNGLDEVQASAYGSKCIQIGGDGFVVTGLKGNMFEIDDGIKYTSVFYDNTKYGTIYNTQGYINGQAYYTTDPTDTAHNRVVINSSNNTLKIGVDGGAMKNIQIADGSYTMSQLVSLLNQEFTAQGIGAKASVRTSGSFESLTITSDRRGTDSVIALDSNCSAYKTLFSHTEYYQKYDVRPVDGVYASIAPTLTGAATLSFPLTIGASNNTLNFVVNEHGIDTTYPITLNNNTYSDINSLLAEINNQLAANGPIDTSNNPKLQAVNSAGTIRLTTTAEGGDITSIKFDAPPGTAYDDLFTKTLTVPASVPMSSNGTASNKPQLSFDFPMNGSNLVDSSNDTFGLYINGIYKEIQIPHGTYTPEELAEIITNGYPRTEETIPNRFTTLSGRGSESMQEGSTIPSRLDPASVTFPTALDEKTIIDGSNNVFKLNVNGSDVSVTLNAGTYNREQLAAELNSKLSGHGVTVSLDQNRLKLTTAKTGSGASLIVSSASGGSAMNVLAGTRKVVISGITASISNGKLVLTGSDRGAGMSLGYAGYGSSASIFIGTRLQKFHASDTGRITTERNTYIQGALLKEPIKIDVLNQHLEFQYEDGAPPAVSMAFDLDNGEYTYATLQTALQQKIDAVLNAQIPSMLGRLKVSIDQKGVRIETDVPGAQYKMSGFSGGFHEKVISGSRLISKDYDPLNCRGEQIATPAYIVGRQDVKNRPVTIQGGINDTLKLDFTYPDQNGVAQEIELELTLTEGSFQGDALAAMIQDKLKAALTNAGLDENLIKVNVGGISTGVIGAEDDNALNFSLNIGNIPNAYNGRYKIDGVRGNAAFYLFYKTEGEPVPAYITGTKDLTGGVVIPAGKNDFSFTTGNTDHEILIPPGRYTSDGLIQAINKCLQDQNISIKASLKDGCLNLAFNNLGNHTITNIGGGARGLIFFQEEGRINADTDLILQIGRKRKLKHAFFLHIL